MSNAKIVAVRTPYMGGPGYQLQVWWANVASEDEAMAKVRRASGCLDDAEVVVTGELDQRLAEEHGMKPGEVIPHS